MKYYTTGGRGLSLTCDICGVGLPLSWYLLCGSSPCSTSIISGTTAAAAAAITSRTTSPVLLGGHTLRCIALQCSSLSNGRRFPLWLGSTATAMTATSNAAARSVTTKRRHCFSFAPLWGDNTAGTSAAAASCCCLLTSLVGVRRCQA